MLITTYSCHAHTLGVALTIMDLGEQQHMNLGHLQEALLMRD